jgi:hypothetical protein
MTGRQKLGLKIAVGFAILAAIGILIRMTIFRRSSLSYTITLTGDVLRQDTDPARQTPLAGVNVSAIAGSTIVTTRSQATGLFSLTIRELLRKYETVTLRFEYPNYKTLEITATHPGDQLYISRMQPLKAETENMSQLAAPSAKTVRIGNVRVRYSLKEESTVNVGSLSKQFTAHNVGNVPCRGRPPCSPDGKWAAYITNLPIDAEEGNEFSNLRVLCLAGPCAFTRILSPVGDRPARKITVSILNWSDTTNFLVEADVVRTMVADSVQYAYPFIVSQTMNYALPARAEGPSIEADLDGQYIVFPLGPEVLLPWATCTVELSQERNKIFRCELKPGYRFEE